MKSRITIEVDFETESSPTQPVLQIIYNSSDDVRDKLVKAFLEKFGHESALCKVEWRIPPLSTSENSQKVILTPISPLHFPDVKKEEQLRTFFKTGEIRGSGGSES